jgi:beta-glucanase (GH16 family)
MLMSLRNLSVARRRAFTLLLALAAVTGYASSQVGTARSATPVAPRAAGASVSRAQTAAVRHTRTRELRVSAPGTYAIIVSIAPVSNTQTVDISVGNQHDPGASVGSSGLKVEFMELLAHPRFGVRVVSHGPAVKFTVADALQPLPSTTPPVPTPASSSSPTGPAAGPYNTLIWSDEFTGLAGTAPNPANWRPDSGGGCGSGTLSTNTANVANADLDGNGHLDINDLGPTASPAYSTAQIDSDGRFSFTYGRIEASIHIASGQGICSAFWMYADDGEQVGWPNGGEIDIMEAIGKLPEQTDAFLHGPIGSSDPNSNDEQWDGYVEAVTPFAAGFHTYGVIWKPNSITWTLDGVPFSTATPAEFPKTSPWVFNDHPFHIIFDEAVGGWPGNPNAATLFPATMQVDWVHVYQ